jgi:transaldolase/glucose-6-phosphate isomerase
MSKIKELQKHGQSIWYDNIRRSMLTSGELQRLLDQGVTGVTSNPTIFEKAIAGSSDYDAALQQLTARGLGADEIYEALVLEDIRMAADILSPIYERTNGQDGYISLEVRPTLAQDTQGTLAEARRLFAALGRPNVMIKVPATREGIPAIEELIAEGINVNVTLIFSLGQYEMVTNAYLAGLHRRVAAGQDIRKVASVASFFISRVDGLADAALEKAGVPELRGKIAIANAKAAYARFQEIFRGAQWEALAAHGAQVQRPLWASTGAKNPAYPDTLYVDGLIGSLTVNTVPPATLSAYLDHGNADLTLPSGLSEAQADLARLADVGVSLTEITNNLLAEGVSAFEKSFETLMTSIVEKRSRLQSAWQPLTAALGGYQSAVDATLARIKGERIVERIWARDHTVWRNDPTEISNRLGWLDIAERMQDVIPTLYALADQLRQEGYQQAILLGMGGSSLAPEVFRKTFGVGEGYLNLMVLDSTDPAAVMAVDRQLSPAKTVFIVSTKSGTTPETLSFFKFFYNRVAAVVGAEQAGEHFIAITDPGSQLVGIAEWFHFRATFLNDPNIGGRYSALSYFGLVPAALLGIDLNQLLDRALTMGCNCEGCNCPIDGNNLGGLLGGIVGALAQFGRDKVTFIASPEIASFGDWVEQLIAESTGKEGKGILPVVGEQPGSPVVYGQDRLFIHLRLEGDSSQDAVLQALQDAGHPVVTLRLQDRYDLVQQFFLWEMATAIAGYCLAINPFDQPNVEAAKILARKMIGEYTQKGALPTAAPAQLSADTLAAFLARAQLGAYIAIQAYVMPTPATDLALQNLRNKLRAQTLLASTVGYGPRFLHSTGQLHKGDAGKGLFIQFTAPMPDDVIIPDEAGKLNWAITFGTLKTAQVLGDQQALLDANRQVIHFHLAADIPQALNELAAGLK